MLPFVASTDVKRTKPSKYRSSTNSNSSYPRSSSSAPRVPETYKDRVAPVLSAEQEIVFSSILTQLEATKRGPRTFSKPVRRSMRHSSSRSYAIVLVYVPETTPTDPATYRVLLGRRRDSIEYCDFIRGLYEYRELPRILSLMTIEERQRSLLPFSQQWDDYWPLESEKYHKSPSRGEAETMYNIVRPFLEQLLALFPSSRTSNEYLCPRGRMNHFNGDPLAVAVKEFQEETRILLVNTSLAPLPLYDEVYYGSNGKIYSTEYYTVVTRNLVQPESRMVEGILRPSMVSNDFDEVKWFTLEELRPILIPQRFILMEKICRAIAHRMFEPALPSSGPAAASPSPPRAAPAI